MHKFILLSLTLLISSKVFSQQNSKDSTVQIGSRNLKVKASDSTSPGSSQKAVGYNVKDLGFLEGWYIDSDGVKHQGYIHRQNYNHFNYKPSLEGKHEKITLRKAESFFYNDRFYKKLRKVSFYEKGLKQVESDEAFAEVLSEGKASLYLIYGETYIFDGVIQTAKGPEPITYKTTPKSFLIQFQPNPGYILISNRYGEGWKQIAELFPNENALVKSKETKRSLEKELLKVVEAYNNKFTN